MTHYRSSTVGALKEFLNNYSDKLIVTIALPVQPVSLEIDGYLLDLDSAKITPSSGINSEELKLQLFGYGY